MFGKLFGSTFTSIIFGSGKSFIFSPFFFVFLDKYIARIPIASCAVVLIVGAWQSVRWSEIKRAFVDVPSLGSFIAVIFFMLLFGAVKGVLFGGLCSFICSVFVNNQYLEQQNHVKPAISSACPAVVRLIRVCFPELIDNIILINAPVEEAGRLARNKAVAKTGLKPDEIGVFFISPCPAKITSFKQPIGTEKSNIDGAIAINDIYPHLLKAMEKFSEHDEMLAFHESGVIGIGWATSGGEASGTLKDNALAADGIENCIKILEEVDRGNLDSVDFIELNACQGGCVGGSLTAENPFIAKSRLMKLRKYNPVSCNHILSEDIPEEMMWSTPIEPCDDVMKLADNVQEAMERMARMKELLKTFPGLDCGTCGAPGCKALAEDVVRGFTTEHDCVFRAREELQDIDNLDDTKKLERIIPAPFRDLG